ncbi:sulfate ABC transporter permease subunit CysW [Anaerocolumna cellulosilytica]|uniref:Sulfate ABC transporter permease subunit CysW n=2 Tax=Anaerocolumna cellulosilytica TaxID=433286 RepID=A0A6S6QXL2_9FIRM|nr:sulfate transport system permease protein [Anaerocolumna cellulosilytica]BCJ95384.1 sulfate ABC transporter permease subunit CysW [Anaerocolumna cellulosilytica]
MEYKKTDRSALQTRKKKKAVKGNYQEAVTVKRILIAVAILFLFFMLVLPLILIITEALKKGLSTYISAVTEEYTVKALKLTLMATFTAVISNTIFGLIAAWCITKFKFKGRQLLTTFIDLPFSISPVIAGLIFVLTYGRNGLFYGFLQRVDMKIVFALPGIFLATIFVTFPFVAREIIPLMEAQGNDEEVAAASMGAKGFTIFLRITLPNIKWGLLYGIILCTARAMGEFGAVSVVSGHIRGKTNTLPLHIEILYSEYQFMAAFAVSSVLVILAVILLILRNLVEWRAKKNR